MSVQKIYKNKFVKKFLKVLYFVVIDIVILIVSLWAEIRCPIVRRTVYKFQAYAQLQDLRESVSPDDADIEALRSKVQTGRFTLEDVGSSEGELAGFHKKSIKFSAKYSLEELRKGDSLYRLVIDKLLSDLHKNNIPLEDVGTSLAEIDHLQKIGAKAAAIENLATLRQGIAATDITFFSFNHELKNADLVPADLGVTAEEMAKFEKLTTGKF